MTVDEIEAWNALFGSLTKYHEWLEEQAKRDEGRHDNIIYRVNKRPEYTAVAEVVDALRQDLYLAFNTYSNSNESLRGANCLSKSIQCAFDTALANPTITTHWGFIDRCYLRFQAWLKKSFDIDIAKAAPTEREKELQDARANISALATQKIQSRLKPNQTLKEGLRQEKADRSILIQEKAAVHRQKHAAQAKKVEAAEVTSSERGGSYLPLAIEYPLGVALLLLLSITAILDATMDEQHEEGNRFRP